MKNLFTILLISLVTFSCNAQNLETKNTGLYYCLQIISTENPQLLKPSMLATINQEAMVEMAVVNGKKWYRIILVYNSTSQQESSFNSIRLEFPNVIKLTRTKFQVESMFPLFTVD